MKHTWQSYTSIECTGPSRLADETIGVMTVKVDREGLVAYIASIPDTVQVEVSLKDGTPKRKLKDMNRHPLTLLQELDNEHN